MEYSQDISELLFQHKLSNIVFNICVSNKIEVKFISKTLEMKEII